VIFSPDGNRIVHQAEGNREGTVMWERRSDGTGPETVLLPEPEEYEFHLTAPPCALFTLSTTKTYEPSLDGQRFLVTAMVSEASPITVILNWKPPAR
jgi:hypothetical protein